MLSWVQQCHLPRWKGLEISLAIECVCVLFWIWYFYFKKYYIYVITNLWVCMFVHTWAGMPQDMCRSQRTVWWNLYSPSTRWIPRVEFWSSILVSGFYSDISMWLPENLQSKIIAHGWLFVTELHRTVKWSIWKWQSLNQHVCHSFRIHWLLTQERLCCLIKVMLSHSSCLHSHSHWKGNWERTRHYDSPGRRTDMCTTVRSWGNNWETPILCFSSVKFWFRNN